MRVSHRWRKLEGSDPGTYEIVQKIQALQKRLIAKTEEVVEKDLLIQEKDKLYGEPPFAVFVNAPARTLRCSNVSCASHHFPSRTQEYSGAAARPRGGGAAFNLPARIARQDEVHESHGL